MCGRIFFVNKQKVVNEWTKQKFSHILFAVCFTKSEKFIDQIRWMFIEKLVKIALLFFLRKLKIGIQSMADLLPF